MSELATLQSAAYVAQIVGVVGTLTAAFIAVRSYINANKRAEEARKKEQETRERELETRQAQMFMNIYDKTVSKEYGRSYDKFMATPFRNWPEFNKSFEDTEFNDAYWNTTMFYEGVGVLVREGLLPIRMVALLMCGATRSYWEKVQPVIEEARRATGFRRWYDGCEYLYDELMKYIMEHPELDTKIETQPRELRQVTGGTPQ